MTAKILLQTACILGVVLISVRTNGQEQALAPAAMAAQSPSSGLEKKQVKMPDGSIREMDVPPGGKLPPGAEIIESKGKAGDAKDPKAGPPEKEATKPVKRGAAPEPADPKELEVVPDGNGLVAFQFRNQAWPDLLKWLAKISHMSLDWQELPGDYVNLATQRKYGIEEARDLFNGHLLARGYTMLEKDGMLQVVKTENINLALVPIVDAADLRALPGNRFVRTSFKLNTLMVDQIQEELQPLKSQNGQLIGLKATNRLEAVDSVSNLLAIKSILDDEQSEEAIALLAREFELQHIRADEAKQQLEIFLGIKKDSSASAAMSSQQMQQMQQMQQQMQQMQQQAGKGAPKPVAGEDKIYLVANTRMNSIIAHAPPDKLAVIAAFVRRIDVPGDSNMSLDMLHSRMRTYRLASLDPERLSASLYNMNALEPKTRIEVDSKNKAILVFGSLADHMLIEQVVKRLDGSAREFDVIQLRRLYAEDVAGTINMLMGGDEAEEDQQQNRYSYYSYFNPRNNDDDKKKDKFRVTANVNDNQVLIWANPQEREEINKLLIKLGEIPPEGGSRSPFRTVDAAKLPETYEYLQRIQKQWSLLSDTPLELPPAELFNSQEADGDPQTSETQDAATSDAPAQPDADEKQEDAAPLPGNEKITSHLPLGKLSQTRAKVSDESSASSSSDTESPAAKQPTIKIGLDPQGNLVLYSEDIEALNALETLMTDIAPPARPYQVVKVKHQTATWITYDLEDYFKDLASDEEKDQDPRAAYYSYIFGIETGQSKKKTPAQLGRKRPLRFIPNNDTQTILVIGADDAIFDTVQRLVELWDVPDKVDDSRVRYTKIVQVKYSRAEVLVETMKEAFRDLLSSNDKAFQKKNDDEKGGESKAAENSSSVTSEGGMDFSFSGKLSFGVDSVTNSILVSCEKQLLQLIVSTIEQLDEAAKPSAGVEVHKIDLAGQESFRKALQAILGQQAKKQQPPQEAQPGRKSGNRQPQGNDQNQNGNMATPANE